MEYNTSVTNPTRFTVFPEGIYDAELVSFEDNLKSKKGNGMSKLSLKVYDGESECRVNDWLVNMDNMLWKIKAFMEAVGQTYGEPIDLEAAKGKLFQVRLKVEAYNGDDQNKVDDYLPYVEQVKAPAAPSRLVKEAEEIPDSALPF